MSKKKRSPFDIQLDVDEQEIENALPESWDKLSITKNLKEDITQAFGMYRVNKKISLKDIQKAIEASYKRTVWI